MPENRRCTIQHVRQTLGSCKELFCTDRKGSWQGDGAMIDEIKASSLQDAIARPGTCRPVAGRLARRPLSLRAHGRDTEL